LLRFFPKLLSLILRSESFLPAQFFTFSLNSALVHFISDESASFPHQLAAKCFPKFRSDQSDIIEYLLCHAFKVNDTKCANYLIELVIASPDLNKAEFYHFLLDFLSPQLSNFNKHALSFLLHLATHCENDPVILQAVERLPSSILGHLDSLVALACKPPPEVEPRREDNISYHIDSIDIFPNGFTPISVHVFDVHGEIEFPESPIFPVLVEFMTALPYIYLTAFLEAFPTSNNSLLLVLVKLLQACPKFSISAKLLDGV
jgi:hypothetical protein